MRKKWHIAEGRAWGSLASVPLALRVESWETCLYAGRQGSEGAIHIASSRSCVCSAGLVAEVRSCGRRFCCKHKESPELVWTVWSSVYVDHNPTGSVAQKGLARCRALQCRKSLRCSLQVHIQGIWHGTDFHHTIGDRVATCRFLSFVECSQLYSWNSLKD